MRVSTALIKPQPSTTAADNQTCTATQFTDELGKAKLEKTTRIMDTTTLAQTLTCAEALKWLQGTLNDPDNEDLDPDEAMSAILEREWETKAEFLEFFKQISIELAKTASKNCDDESVCLYGRNLSYSLSMGSPYYKLWEKAFNTKSPLLNSEIDIQEWGTYAAVETEQMKLVNMIPFAAAYSHPIFEALRNQAIEEPSSAEEEFLAWLAVSLQPGFYDGYLPIEIVNIPSSKVLAEIFEDWSMYEGIWNPDALQLALESQYADANIKNLIARVLRGESDYNPEEWEEHREEYWSDEEIEEVLSLCEEPQS
jgi:hypothetical protein